MRSKTEGSVVPIGVDAVITELFCSIGRAGWIVKVACNRDGTFWVVWAKCGSMCRREEAGSLIEALEQVRGQIGLKERLPAVPPGPPRPHGPRVRKARA